MQPALHRLLGAEYGNKLNLTFEQLDSIVSQGKELGTFMYISGGEPLVRKDDIIRLCEKHSDCEFLAFTNSTLIDEKFADDMLRVKNFIPAISIEGYEEQTDFRRGKGTYQKVLSAMKILHEKRLPFGASLCYTRKNTENIGSDEYFDFLIAQVASLHGCSPICPSVWTPSPELMVTVTLCLLQNGDALFIVWKDLFNLRIKAGAMRFFWRMCASSWTTI